MYPLPTHSLHTQSAISLKKSSLMPSSRSRLHANWAESIENWGLVVSRQVRHQPPQDWYKLGGEKASVDIFFCPVIKGGFRWNCAPSPPLHTRSFKSRVLLSAHHQSSSNQPVQKSSTAWKTCVEMLYYCIFSQLRSTCDNCTVTLVVDILGICYSSYSMILLKNEKENYFCYKCNAYHVFHVSLNSAQLETTAPSRSLSIVRIF